MKKKLKDVCTIEKGKQIDTKSLDDSNSYRYINGGIKESGFYNDFNTSGEAVLISEGGASCGYVNYINEKFWCGCHCYRLTDIKVYPKFLFYSLKASQNGIMELRTGAAMPNIKKESLKNFEVSIIEDKEDQIKIAAHLDKIQSAIDNKKQQLSLLDEAVKSEFVEMFGDPVTNHMGWKKILGEELFKLSNGKLVANNKRFDDGIPAYGGNGLFCYTDQYLITGETIIIGRVGFQSGNVHYVEGALWVTDNAMYISEYDSKIIRLEFLYMLMDYIDFKHFQDMGDLKKITQKPFMQMSYILPSIKLQDRYLSFVQKIDNAKSLVKQQLANLQELLDSKMQQYFA